MPDAPPSPSPAPRRLATLEQERRARAWRSCTTGISLLAVCQLAYVFIDRRVFPGTLTLPLLRAAHVVLCLAVLGWLYARRHTPTLRLANVAFIVVTVPLLPLFAMAEAAMAATHPVWTPMLGHRLVMLGIALFAPVGFRAGAALIVAFAVEVVALWYGLGLDARLPDAVWEPWVTLIYAAVGLTMLGYRVRNRRVTYRLRRARAEAEALERLARLFLALRDAASTPLQSLEIGTALLRQRAPGCEPTLDSMERALTRLRNLTQRMSTADPLLVWREGEESFDADTVLRHLEESLTRELERRRH